MTIPDSLTKKQRRELQASGGAIIEWGYQKYGEFDYGDFSIGDVDRGGDIEEAVNVAHEAIVFDKDRSRLLKAVRFLEPEVSGTRVEPELETFKQYL